MQSLFRPLVYGRCEWRLRIDGKYSVWQAKPMSDLGIIPIRNVRRAIDNNMPWLNPLKWIQIAVCTTRDEAHQLCVKTFRTATEGDLTKASKVSQSLIEYDRAMAERSAGDFG